jgi:hypothetical protein
MQFKEKYTTVSKKSEDKEKKESSKIELSEEVFALCEILQDLTNAIEGLRTKIR